MELSLQMKLNFFISVFQPDIDWNPDFKVLSARSYYDRAFLGLEDGHVNRTTNYVCTTSVTEGEVARVKLV